MVHEGTERASGQGNVDHFLHHPLIVTMHLGKSPVREQDQSPPLGVPDNGQGTQHRNYEGPGKHQGSTKGILSDVDI